MIYIRFLTEKLLFTDYPVYFDYFDVPMLVRRTFSMESADAPYIRKNFIETWIYDTINK